MTDPKSPSSAPRAPETTVVTAGRHPMDNHGVVNPPVYHASTILFDSLDSLENPGRVTTPYGRRGTPGTFALEEAMLALEGAPEESLCRLVPSGLAAVTTAILSVTGADTEILVADTVYDPTRLFCDGLLRRFGVEARYFDPCIGAGIEALIGPKTNAIMLESPGSRSFEVMDVPAITKVAQERGLWTLMDNTWASPLYFKPLTHGVDISIQAATKFLVGHSDVLMGTLVAAPRAAAATLSKTHRQLGHSVGPDDVYLTLRGIRTLAVRMKQHWASGMALARWLQEREEVSRVLYPPLPQDPGHALWRRDFTGASGLFGMVLTSGTRAQVSAFLDGLSLFGLGYSFGGYESLIVPTDIGWCRTATQWAPEGPVFRIHAGLEAVEDLIADLEAGFERFHAAA